MIVDLAERLRSEKGRLAVRVVDEMFTNPFWTERYAARGRRFAEEDLGHHVEYLAQALVARDARVLERYARWLQSVLTNRGMCTVHLDDSFSRLDRVIAESIENPGAAHSYLESARGALLYDEGPARELQEASTRIAESVVAELHASHPDWAARWGARGRALCVEDVGYHLSYLADAIALDRSASFEAYVAWIDAFLRRRGIDGDHLTQTLDVLRQTVAGDVVLSEKLRTAVALALARGES